MQRPQVKPVNRCFSSGPCAKRPGWSLAALEGVLGGRSHRSAPGKARLREVIDRSKAVLGLPEDYRLGIVPASDTGAVEMCLWSMLGARGVDVFAWESFGKGWVTDITKHLKLDDVRSFIAPYGGLPDLSQAAPDRDVVFAWNGTTSGVRVPDGDWISDDRTGLTICDATSAAFAMDLPWSKLDAVTWSWQKVLGGEAAHGMLALSPRAVERLEGFDSGRPLPKIFRLLKGGKLNEGVFVGNTINTPSMLAVEDAIDSLKWAESVGSLSGLLGRTRGNLSAMTAWVERTPWIDFLAEKTETRSSTSMCLQFVDPSIRALDTDGQAKFAKRVVALLADEDVAYDIGSYRDAPPGLRIWGGATIDTSDLEALSPWLEWAYAEAIASLP